MAHIFHENTGLDAHIVTTSLELGLIASTAQGIHASLDRLLNTFPHLSFKLLSLRTI